MATVGIARTVHSVQIVEPQTVGAGATVTSKTFNPYGAKAIIIRAFSTTDTDAMNADITGNYIGKLLGAQVTSSEGSPGGVGLDEFSMFGAQPANQGMCLVLTPAIGDSTNTPPGWEGFIPLSSLAITIGPLSAVSDIDNFEVWADIVF